MVPRYIVQIVYKKSMKGQQCAVRNFYFTWAHTADQPRLEAIFASAWEGSQWDLGC